MVEFTTVVGVDEKHVEQLEVTWPTWERYRPEILARPLLFLCDGRLSEPEWSSRLSFVRHPDRRIVRWHQLRVSQREKMLTALTLLPPREVVTEWYLKLDTDVVALSAEPWLHYDWFAPDDSGRLPAFVSNPWGYTKPPDAIDRLDLWANGRPEFEGTDPLYLHPEPGSTLVSHPRIASWIFFGNTAWTRVVTSTCSDHIPVPSQDTFLWYCAERRGDFYRRVRMKRFGWTNCSRLRHLRMTATQALIGPAVPRAISES